MMKSFREALRDNKFPVTYEPDLPSGINPEESLIEADLDVADALCVYNNPGGKPKLDPFVYGWKLKEKYGKDVVVNIRVQDYSIPLFQSALWGGQVLGIENLLLITGDYHQNSPFLISVTEGLTGINKYLNEGYLLPSLTDRAKRYENRLTDEKREDKYGEGTDYFTGAAMVPGRPNESDIYRKKVEAGAEFFMTQITYSTDDMIDFMEEVEPSKPILIGSAPISSIGSLEFFKNKLNVKGLSDDMIKRLKESDNIGGESVEICTEMYKEIKSYAEDHDYSLGAHIMSVGSPELARDIARRI